MSYIIIGNSAAGVSAAETIRDIDRTSPISLISDEPHGFYSKSLLPDLISGKISQEKTLLRNESFYKDLGIEAILGEKVERISPKKNSVTLCNGKEIEYDKLLIATGVSPKVMIEIDKEADNFYMVRTLEDAIALREAALKAKRATVIGAGLIGLKIAAALHSLGLDITVLGKYEILLPRVMDATAGEILKELFEDNGVKVFTKVKVSGVNADSVQLSDDRSIASDIVVMATGVKPNIDLLEGTEIAINQGIITDAHMRTNLENIYAAGDIVEDKDILGQEKGFLNPIWPKAVLQGRIAGTNMAGRKREFTGSMMMNSIEFFNTPLISAGIIQHGQGRFKDEIITFNKQDKIYQKLIFEKDRLKGAVLLGKIDKAGVITNLIREQRDISSMRGKLLSESFGYGNALKTKEAPQYSWII
ncbi:MAG: FAD-dependent oxidoreductase [Thermodesulfobacteriota bacterium]|nr:FAD-dependent oxidoreductase [Thermodesulfobacteriota bacterium]